MTDHHEPPAVIAALAEQIRIAREQSGVTQAELAGRINYSDSAISMVETAQRVPTRDMIRRIDDALSADGKLHRLWQHAAKQNATARIIDLIDAEQRAVAIYEFHPVLVPGLLQTKEYAQAILRAGEFTGASSEEIDERIATRLNRQKVLARSRPPQYWVVLGEGALRLRVGSDDIMRAQLSYLREITKSRHVNIQVIPFDAGAGLYSGTGPMQIIDVNSTSVVYLEDPIVGRTISDASNVGEYKEQFDLMRSQAPSVADSALRVERLMEELWTANG
jgi:transcriptional regulator with XRE-family HTH domain